jgi:hypothetical protein
MIECLYFQSINPFFSDTSSSDRCLRKQRQNLGLDDLTVTEGVLNQTSAQIACHSGAMRCEARGYPEADYAFLRFQYNGPTVEVVPLADNTTVHQCGIKLRAQDTCNVVYAIWKFDTPQRLSVSVKSNPGQNTVAQCQDGGYINNIPALFTASTPNVALGSLHSLEAKLVGNRLTVTCDCKLVWDGYLPAVVYNMTGPPGMRSDNADILFNLYI